MIPKLIIFTAAVQLVIGGQESFFEGIERVSLHGKREDNVWFASGVNASGIGVRISATVPGGIYSDLEESGRLDSNIYYEYNDEDTRWVGRSDWVYERNFSVPFEMVLKDEIVLVCEGLDTVGSVFINNFLVGEPNNMFVRYVFNIKSYLMFGTNSIRIELRSPVEYAHEKYDEHIAERGYPVPPEALYPTGEPKVQMIRKMQSSFSWDWGPSYPNTGVWKDMYIEGYSGAVIRDVMIFLESSKEIPDETEETRWTVTARVYYDAANDEEGATVSFGREGGPRREMDNLSLKKGKGNSFDVTLTENGDMVELWWPNGYGAQPLYRYGVALISNAGLENSTKTVRIGFRTIEVVDNLVDPENPELGREFYFKVNGVKIYAKGANSIPLHVLPERVTEEMTDWLFRSAAFTFQNIVRVWGGGIYESETFFDKADEYGILVWEDFQFAVAMYPAQDRFIESVGEEVMTQVKRLQHRTSLALWSGNNEAEAFLQLFFNGLDYYPSLKEDYLRLYIDTVKVITEELDPSRVFLPSSPTNGVESIREGGVAENPMDTRYVDVHFYNYAEDSWDWRMFPKARFVSEYGYQSWPHYDSLKGITDDITTWTWESNQMEHRQRHPNGQAEIRELIRQHLPFPNDYNSTEAFPHMIYLSQVEAAVAQKTQTESYRRLVDKLDEQGQGHNMGAIYWQLNDIWPGCSWASVESGMRWKLQMYYTKHFFAPVLISPYREANGDVVVELISDVPQPVNTTASVRLYKLGKDRESMDPVFSVEFPVEAEFLKSKEVLRIENDTLAQFNCAEVADSGTAEPCFILANVDSHYLEDNFLWLQYPKNKQALRNPNHRVSNLYELGDFIFFTLETDAISPFVYLTVRGDHKGYFSDNGFIQVEKEKVYWYVSWSGMSKEEFLERLTVMSLYETTLI